MRERKPQRVWAAYLRPQYYQVVDPEFESICLVPNAFIENGLHSKDDVVTTQVLRCMTWTKIMAESKGEGSMGDRAVKKSDREEDWLGSQGWAGLVDSWRYSKGRGESMGSGMGRCWIEDGEGVSWHLRERLTHEVSQVSQPTIAFFVGAPSP